MSFWNGIIQRGWSAPPPMDSPGASSSSSVNASERQLSLPPWDACHVSSPPAPSPSAASSSSMGSFYASLGTPPAFSSLSPPPSDGDWGEVASCRTAAEIQGDYEDEDDAAMEDVAVPANHPRRFEERRTQEGTPFFVDHHLQITSWSILNPTKTLRRKAKYVREQVLGRVRSTTRPGARERVCFLRIRRDDFFESSFEEIARKTPEELRRRLAVDFQGEDGVDAGGLTREFFHLISTHISNPAYGLFHAPSAEHPDLLSINPMSSINPAHLDYFRVVGRLIGLALINGEKVSVGFAAIVWKLLVGGLDRPPVSAPSRPVPLSSVQESRRRRRRRSDDDEGDRSAADSVPKGKRRRKVDIGIEDLRGVDDALSKSLEWVRMNDPSVLCRSFTFDVDHFGTPRSIPLRLDGASIDVTEANKEAYVREMARFVLLENVRGQTEAMLKGVYEVVEAQHLATLEPEEMELLLCGISVIDVDDWQRNTDYRGGYHATSPTVQLFWAFVRTLSQDQLTSLLQFVTGSPRLPPGGFADLKANGSDLKRFTIIMDARSGPHRLPSAHTCFNELELPVYKTWVDMQRGIMLAIAETAGFGLA